MLECDTRLALPGNAPDAGAAPWAIQIQTVQGCNARCVMCPAGRAPVCRATMHERLWERVVDGLQGIAVIAPFLMAEPLLDADLERRIQRARTRWPSAAMVLSTNGLLLTAKRASALIAAGVTHLTVSLYSADPDRYRALTGLPLPRILRNVQSVLPVARQAGIVFRIKALDKLLRPGERETLRARWGLDEDVRIDVGYLHDRAGNAPLTSFPSVAETAPLAAHAAGCLDRERPWRVMHVLVDGRVVLCCCDWTAAHVLGDLTTHTVAEVWQGAPYEALRAALAAGDRSAGLILCDSCAAARRTTPREPAER